MLLRRGNGTIYNDFDTEDVILHGVSEVVDELSPEVIFGLIAELLHESESSLFAEVHERKRQDNDGHSNPRGWTRRNRS
jgi:hypothetical protein